MVLQSPVNLEVALRSLANEPGRRKTASKQDWELLKGSWDLVTRLINEVTILTSITLLTKSHDPPSRYISDD